MSATPHKDAGEAFRTHGVNGFADHVKNNTRPFDPKDPQKKEEPKLPDIVDIMDFLSQPLVKPPELIKGILHKGSKLILSGASKSRKTWALTHLALCVAAGLPWWGFTTTPGKVLYANFELGPEFFQERVQAIKEHVVLEGSKLRGQLKLWNLRGHAANISVLADQIIEQTKDQYDLIIFDPIYKILGDRDENSNSDVALMMNVFDHIIKETGSAVAFAHHFSKGNQSKREAMDRMSGAGAFARDADSLLVMTKHEQPDTYTVESILRYHKPQEPFCVTLEYPIMVRNENLDASKMKAANGLGKKYVVADLLKVLNVQQLTRAELNRQFVPKVASQGTFNTLFKEAQETKIIELCEDNKKWKAVQPVYPPGWKAGNDQPEADGTKVQD